MVLSWTCTHQSVSRIPSMFLSILYPPSLLLVVEKLDTFANASTKLPRSSFVNLVIPS